MNNNYDRIDKFFCENQLIGGIFKRVYAYFKKHTAITDGMHVSLGLGVGLLISNQEWFYAGLFFIAVGLAGHVVAFIKRGK